MNSKPIDLSFKTPDYGSMAGGPSNPADRPMKDVYPTFSINEKPALAKSLEVGQEIKAVVTMKVTEVMLRQRSQPSEYPGENCRVEFDVTSIQFQDTAISDDDGDEEKGGDQAIHEFFSKVGKGGGVSYGGNDSGDDGGK